MNVLVIGGSSGIGYATAAGAVAEGANVTIASRSEEKLRAAQALLQRRVEIRRLDVANTAEVDAFFDASSTYDHVAFKWARRRIARIRSCRCCAIRF